MANSIQFLYDNGKTYKFSNIRQWGETFNYKQEDCIFYEYETEEGFDVRVRVPMRDVAAIRVKFHGNIILKRLKPCAKIVAEISKRQ